MTLTPDDLKSIREISIDGSQSVLEGVQKMFDEHNKAQNERFESVETKIKNVEAHLKDEIDGLKGEFSQQVSKKDFNLLKTKVDKYAIS